MIFTAKAFAIKAALEIMYNDANNISRNIVILSDSRSVLQALTNNQLSVLWDINRNFKNPLKRELNKRIIFIWIVHVGI